MYIKSVTARGFLCYKDAMTVTLDPSFNIIVGPNGSGKSSILSAIQFVLSGISAGDKTLCLHEGVSTKVLVGYVYIIFDNLDKRLPGFDSPEVVVRRDFGFKRDDITINDKKVTRQELLSLLESAGFSKSNPYYFVRQHEVAALTRMRDSERLSLLKEVAGTSVYDARRAEAYKSLEQTRGRRDTIDSTLAVISGRMKELKEEQHELAEYQKVEREKRCIEFDINEKHISESTNQLEALLAERDMYTSKQAELNSELVSIQDEIKTIKEENERVTLDYNMVAEEQKELQDQEMKLSRESTHLSLEIKAKNTDKQKSQAFKEKNLALVASLQKSIAEVESRIREMRPETQKAEEKHAEDVSLLMKYRREIDQLSAKNHRSSEFKSVAERNKSLETEIKKREKNMKEMQKTLEKANVEIKFLLEGKESKGVTLPKLMKKREVLDREILELSEKLNKINSNFAEMTGAKEKLEQEIHSLTKVIHRSEIEAKQAIRKVNQTTRMNQLSANTAAQRWSEENNKPGSVRGTLLENIRVDPKYFIAVETAAGGQLLNLLVSDRKVAIEVVKYIKKHKEGSTTITPLKEISFRDQGAHLKSPPRSDTRVSLLSDYINTSTEDIKSAVKQVFGKYLLCSDRDVGNEYKDWGYDCITLEGDKISRKGILSGGYRGNQTRLASYYAYLQATELLQSSTLRQTVVQKQLDDIVRDARQLFDERDKGELRKEEKEMERMKLIDLIHEMESESIRFEETYRKAVCQQRELLTSIESDKEDIQRFRREIACPNLGELNAAETKRMGELSNLIPQLETAAESSRSVAKKSAQQLSMELSQLNDVLRPQLYHLEDEILRGTAETPTALLTEQEESTVGNEPKRNKKSTTRGRKNVVDDDPMSSSSTPSTIAGEDSVYGDEWDFIALGGEVDVDQMVVKKKRVDDRLEELKLQLVNNDTKMTQLKSLINQSSTSLTQKVAKKEKITQRINQMKINSSTFGSKSEALRRQIDEYTSKRLVIPGSQEMLAKLKKKSFNEVTKQLAAVNKKLTQFQHINNKALDQFSNFMDEEAQLINQRNRLYKSEESICELMSNLDNQKDDTLLKTFENVNNNFGKVFSEIVAGGSSKLILKKISDEEIEKLRAIERERQMNNSKTIGGVTKENVLMITGDTSSSGNVNSSTNDDGDVDMESQEDKRERSSNPSINNNQIALVSQPGHTSTSTFISPPPSLEIFTGIGIKVKFPSFKGYMSVENLSGGQKSVVALSLMFALQRVDSAPFYILDEVDSSLDVQYRESVANLIKSQSSSHQFIVISHKKETINAASKFFKASMMNRCGHIQEVLKGEALLVSQRQAMEDQENKKI